MKLYLLAHKETSLALGASQTKPCVQHCKVCCCGVLDSGLGPRLVTETIKNNQFEMTVLKQRVLFPFLIHLVQGPALQPSNRFSDKPCASLMHNNNSDSTVD